MRAPLFKALTRPVSFMGLPMTYFALLVFTVVGGFIVLSSFVWLIASFIILYAALRALAAFDPSIFDVFLKTVRATPITGSQMQGKGVRYEP